MRVVYCKSFTSTARSYLKDDYGNVISLAWARHDVPICMLGAFNKAAIFTVSHSHWDLCLYRVSSRNSKMSFFSIPEGDYGNGLCQCVKIPVSQQQQGMGTNLFGVFIYAMSPTCEQNELKRKVTPRVVPSDVRRGGIGGDRSPLEGYKSLKGGTGWLVFASQRWRNFLPWLPLKSDRSPLKKIPADVTGDSLVRIIKRSKTKDLSLFYRPKSPNDSTKN